MLIHLKQALAEIKTRQDIEGRALTRGDLYDAIAREDLSIRSQMYPSPLDQRLKKHQATLEID